MFNVSSRPPMYDQNSVQPMRDELVAIGFTELLTPHAVEDAVKVNNDETVFVMINSVCGCAAGSAKPRVYRLLCKMILSLTSFTLFLQDRKEMLWIK